MLRALGKKLIVRPEPLRTCSDGGIHLLPGTDPVGSRVYLLISAGPKVSLTGLSHGCRMLLDANTGQSFEFEGHPLRVFDQDDVLMLLP
jgi:hypothetical protein